MMDKIPSFERLVESFSRLPGIGKKTAQRLAYYVLRSKNNFTEEFREAIKQVKELINECPTCYTYTENEGDCYYCVDVDRRNDMFCVVEDPADIQQLESSGAFKGRYHVLHGAINPLDGVGPDDLRIKQLISRIKSQATDGEEPIKEVILALDANLEGDTTALYLAKALSEFDIQVSRIAHGVPIGGHIDYVDHRTLGKALENRIVL